MAYLLLAFGVALILGAVGAIYAPAAGILAGALCVALALGYLRAEEPRA